MTENQLYALLQVTLTDGLVATNLPSVDVRQAYQPSITGRPIGPAVLLSNQPSQRYGFLKRDDVWDAEAGRMIHTETQIWTTTFQCGALAEQTPSVDPALALTAGDLVRRASTILQSDAGRGQLQAGGAGVLRITEVRAPYFKNDQDTFEASPSFDFTLCYVQADIYAGVPVERTGGTATPI